jgi:hypothetical protein
MTPSASVASTIWLARPEPNRRRSQAPGLQHRAFARSDQGLRERRRRTARSGTESPRLGMGCTAQSGRPTQGGTEEDGPFRPIPVGRFLSSLAVGPVTARPGTPPTSRPGPAPRHAPADARAHPLARHEPTRSACLRYASRAPRNRPASIAVVLLPCCRWRSLPVNHGQSHSSSESSKPTDSGDSGGSTSLYAGFGKLMFCH